MSHKSKLMLPILAVIVGVAASAFTVNNYKSSADNLWYFEYFLNDFAGTPAS